MYARLGMRVHLVLTHIRQVRVLRGCRVASGTNCMNLQCSNIPAPELYVYRVKTLCGVVARIGDHGRSWNVEVVIVSNDGGSVGTWFV